MTRTDEPFAPPSKPDAARVVPGGETDPSSQATPVRAPVGEAWSPMGLGSTELPSMGAPDARAEVQGGVWIDPDPLDDQWRPPSRWTLVPTWAKWLIPVVVVVVLVTGVTLSGGLKPSTQLQRTVTAGTPVTIGPVVWTPRWAEWQWSDSSNAWQLLVSGSCAMQRNPYEVVRSFEMAKAMAAHRPKVRAGSTDTLMVWGEARPASGLSLGSLTPGGAPVVCYAMFDFASRSEPPESEVMVLAVDLTYVADDNAQTGGKGWKLGDRDTWVRLPAVVSRPPDKP